MSDNLVLDVRNLRTYFYQHGGVIKAVDGVSYQIKRGETVGFVGESGCGKTINSWSVMRLIPGNGRIVEGEILLHRWRNGKDEVLNLAEEDPDGETMCYIRGGEIGMIFQEPMTSLSPVHTVGSQIAEAILLHENINPADARQRTVDLLRRVGIPRPDKMIHDYPHQLSGGMRQRIMIAIALACYPDLLIADEPTTALDVTIQAQILNLMRSLQAELKMSIMFITHDLGVIAEMTDRVFVMYLGKIVEKAAVEEIFYEPLHPYTQALLKSIPGIQAKSKTMLETIQGSIPSPYALITGCPFFERCPKRIEGRCASSYPPTTVLANDHHVDCHLYG